MKITSSVCLLIACCSASANGWNILDALHHKKHPHKKNHMSKKEMAKNDPMGIMNSIMAAAQVGQGEAEKHQKKIVNIARQNVTNLLQQQSTVLAQGIMHFNSEFATASEGVVQAISSSSKLLDQAAKQAAKQSAKEVTSWSSIDLGDVQLKAQKSFAETSVKKAERKRARAITEALSDSEILLDNGVHKVSLRIGDVTELVNQAKKDLEQKTESMPVPSPALVQESTFDMKTAGAALSTAQKQAEKDREAAKAHLSKVLDQTEKDLASGADAVLAALDRAQQEEFKTIRGSSIPMPAPAVKRSLRQHGEGKK